MVTSTMAAMSVLLLVACVVRLTSQQAASPPYALEMNSATVPRSNNNVSETPQSAPILKTTLAAETGDNNKLDMYEADQKKADAEQDLSATNVVAAGSDMSPTVGVDDDQVAPEERSRVTVTAASSVETEVASKTASEVQSRASGGQNSNLSSSSSNNNNNNNNNRGQARAREEASGVQGVGGSIVTPPPIRSLLEVAPENYTARRIAEEANVFAVRMANQLNIEKLGDKNLVLAPFSVFQALVLLMAGSMGDTASEMDRVLLGSSSAYANARLTHDPDRPRLLASLGEVVRRLDAASRASRTNISTPPSKEAASSGLNADRNNQMDNSAGDGAVATYTEEDGADYIVANNILFAPGSSEVAPEFRATLAAFHNNTALTEIEPGSTEAVHQVNNWIRAATSGLVPQLLERHSTFDEYNVMTVLCTAWISQLWGVPFRRRTAALKTSIRLREPTNKRSLSRAEWGGLDGQLGGSPDRSARQVAPPEEQQQFYPATRFGPQATLGHLMEFVDDKKQSHFVEYIQSAPSDQIQHFSTSLNNQRVELVVVPFRDSTHRLITITPASSGSQGSLSDRTYQTAATGGGPLLMALNSSHLFPSMGSGSSHVGQTQHSASLLTSASDVPPNSNTNAPPPVSAESSPLSRLLAALAANPRRAMRKMWSLVAPEMLTRQTLAALHAERHRNLTLGETTIEALLPPPVRLSIPVIKNRADQQQHSLNGALNQIGLVNAFDRNQANFIAINGHPFNYHKLHLSQVISQTSLNINERGLDFDPTISSLEPLRIFSNGSSNKSNNNLNQRQQTPDMLADEVKLNKPFMYLVCDTKTKLILFSGLLRNPLADS